LPPAHAVRLKRRVRLLQTAIAGGRPEIAGKFELTVAA
jgi:hypothetical protein